MHVAIIGGGPCGLGAAWRLDELFRSGVPKADDWMLLEAEAEAGGLAASVVDTQGFTSVTRTLASLCQSLPLTYSQLLLTFICVAAES